MPEILWEMSSKFEGSYPEMPIAESFLAEISDPDPVFVTLPIGQVGVMSRNKRYYDRAAMETLVNTINTEGVMGQKGHLRDDERGHKFDMPPLHWIKASMESDGTVWGKAYVAQSAPDVREYVRLSKINKSKVGTSIYGTADVDDEGKVTSLDIESIDLAHHKRLGVRMAAAEPIVTSETQKDPVSEARPGDLTTNDYVTWEEGGMLMRGRVNTIWTSGQHEVPGSEDMVTATDTQPYARMDVFEPFEGGWRATGAQAVRAFAMINRIMLFPQMDWGVMETTRDLDVDFLKEAMPGELEPEDYVAWQDDGRLMRGRINTIWTSGEVEIPGTDIPVTATEDMPLARMDVFEPSDDGWRSWGSQVIQRFEALTKLDSLPQMDAETMPNVEAGNEEPSEEIQQEITGDDPEMDKIQELEKKIAEMSTAHKETVRTLSGQVAENNDKLADYSKIAELLGKPQDVIVALQALQVENKALRRENLDLLQESIKVQVAEKIKVETVQPMIEQMVKDRKPVRRVDVTTAIEEIAGLDYVKTLLKSAVVDEMGPPHERPLNPPATTPQVEESIFIPGAGIAGGAS